MLVVGNWKMNMDRASAKALVSDLIHGLSDPVACDVGICVPTVFLDQTSSQLVGQQVGLGAQNASEYESGAYTGETSAAMLAEFGCRWVLVGHSERRQLFHESNEQVADKAVMAQTKGLVPIVCVGETLEQREADQTFAVIEQQLRCVLQQDGLDLSRVVWAYEPVWAIGTGMTATPEQAQAVHAFIRDLLSKHDSAIAKSAQILYGGSVNADNAAELFSQSDIDGGLIGGASLKAESFLAICRSAV